MEPAETSLARAFDRPKFGKFALQTGNQAESPDLTNFFEANRHDHLSDLYEKNGEIYRENVMQGINKQRSVTRNTEAVRIALKTQPASQFLPATQDPNTSASFPSVSDYVSTTAAASSVASPAFLPDFHDAQKQKELAHDLMYMAPGQHCTIVSTEPPPSRFFGDKEILVDLAHYSNLGAAPAIVENHVGMSLGAGCHAIQDAMGGVPCACQFWGRAGKLGAIYPMYVQSHTCTGTFHVAFQLHWMARCR